MWDKFKIQITEQHVNSNVHMKDTNNHQQQLGYGQTT